MKGYSSNQSEFRIVIALKAAEPMAVRVLVVGEHACRTERWRLQSLSVNEQLYKTSHMHPSQHPVSALALSPVLPPTAGARGCSGKDRQGQRQARGGLSPLAPLGARAMRSSVPLVTDILHCRCTISFFTVLHHLHSQKCSLSNQNVLAAT